MALTDLLAALVRGDDVAPEAWRAINVDEFCRAADHHGVLPLVADRLRTSATGAPAALAVRAADLARRHAAADLLTEVELRAALQALDAAGLQPVVFKGAHLAYSHYARPDLRPRADTDLLIAADAHARQAAHDVLIGLGYDSPAHVGGDLVMTQRAYVKRRAGDVSHAIDVHWRIANPQLFSRVLTHEELLRQAVPLPALGPAARGASAPHALMIACVHRVAHHADSDCLIWLYDIDRIARRLTPVEWSAFLAIASERRVVTVCRASLDRTVSRFGTPIPESVRRAAGAGEAPEPSARYLDPPGDPVASAISDWKALPSFRERARLAREHLAPPADYMRTVYAPGSRAPLVWLYLRRMMAGARAWRRRRFSRRP